MCAGASNPGVEPYSFQGNPINLLTGDKGQVEVDCQLPGDELNVRRIYNGEKPPISAQALAMAGTTPIRCRWLTGQFHAPSKAKRKSDGKLHAC